MAGLDDRFAPCDAVALDAGIERALLRLLGMCIEPRPTVIGMCVHGEIVTQQHDADLALFTRVAAPVLVSLN